ncbi:MAG: crossover junction endodeoxyribonuclease RuvC [Rickettsiales bacterium]|jgi:crossover junction endodeoxyribonuclease RuvC|nr:crossover junction endodeoxyribonuclease RuvC [Rickettsiales bacterium]
MRILGIDPGLRFTGWGVVDFDGGRFSHAANGTIKVPVSLSLAERLAFIHKALRRVVEEFKPQAAAIEEPFVNINPASTLKLGAARGVALAVPALFGVPVAEFSPNLIKKSVAGVGHARKEQIEMMVGVLLAKPKIDSEHAADALAIAIARAYNRPMPKT